MLNYEPNSHKSKTEKKDISEKKVTKVITGTATTRKRSELRKLGDVFLSEDVRNVKSYIMLDVLVPAIKKALYDIITNGADMVLYGGTGGSKPKGSASKVSYTRYYDRGNDSRDYHARGRNTYDHDDILVDTRAEANRVLEGMNEIVESYGIVSVADLKELAGVRGAHTDNKYGWTDVRAMDFVRTRDGRYLIRTPRAMPID